MNKEKQEKCSCEFIDQIDFSEDILGEKKDNFYWCCQDCIKREKERNFDTIDFQR